MIPEIVTIKWDTTTGFYVAAFFGVFLFLGAWAAVMAVKATT